jgi:hypothetical protein
MSPALLLALLAGMGPGTPTTQGATFEYSGGLWFDGEGFRPGTRWVVDGVFRESAPERVDVHIDLGGRHVVPPYGEGHTHLLEPDLAQAYSDHFLHRGVFYARDLGNAGEVFDGMHELLARPDTLDAVSAKQGLTGPGGHPLQILDQVVGAGLVPEWVREEGRGVFVVSSQAELEAAWPRLLAAHPDLVKVFLLYSEEHERRHADEAYRYRRGIDPALVPWIVEHAHAAELPVAAHVYTAHDFAVAVRAGVDLIAHFPGTGYEPELGVQAFQLDEEIARLAAERGVAVLTTLCWLQDGLAPALQRQLLDEVIVPNLDLLLSAGVELQLGSDQFRATSDVEARALHELELFAPLELLTMWCETTPRGIFPGRKIGRLEEGYEASFLVLEGDPLEDFAATERIVLRVKQGHVLLPPDRAFPVPGGR